MDPHWTSAIAESVTAIGALLAAVIAIRQLGELVHQAEIQTKQVIAQADQTKILAQQAQAQANQTRLLAEQARNQVEQLRIIGDRERQWQTIAACQRYVHDPMLVDAKRRIWVARDYGRKSTIDEPHTVKQDVIFVVNYLDTLGIGVHQGVYLEQVVKDHLYHVIMDVVARYVKGSAGKFDLPEAELIGLMMLYDKFVKSGAPGHIAVP